MMTSRPTTASCLEDDDFTPRRRLQAYLDFKTVARLHGSPRLPTRTRPSVRQNRAIPTSRLPSVDFILVLFMAVRDVTVVVELAAALDSKVVHDCVFVLHFTAIRRLHVGVQLRMGSTGSRPPPSTSRGRNDFAYFLAFKLDNDITCTVPRLARPSTSTSLAYTASRPAVSTLLRGLRRRLRAAISRVQRRRRRLGGAQRRRLHSSPALHARHLKVFKAFADSEAVRNWACSCLHSHPPGVRRHPRLHPRPPTCTTSSPCALDIASVQADEEVASPRVQRRRQAMRTVYSDARGIVRSQARKLDVNG